MRTTTVSISLILALALIAVGCGGGGGGGGEQGGGGGGSEVRPALVLDIGGLGDQGFNDSAYAGMKRAQEDMGVEGEYLESTSPTD